MTFAGTDMLKAKYESIIERMVANPEMDLLTLRSIFEELATMTREPEDVTYAEADVDGIRGLWCRPNGAPLDKALLYFHGGGFMGNTADSHRKMVGHLARAAGVNALVLDYRLAPENPFPAQLDDAVTGYRWLRAQGIPSGGIATAGDSAGGNLAVAIALRLRAEDEELPGAIVTFSPWLDMELTGETLSTNAVNDASISMHVVTMMSSAYLGETGSRTDPFANPLVADLSGLPPVFVATSTDEALFSDSERFADKASAAGTDVEFIKVPGQQHVFTITAGRTPEADDAIFRAGSWLSTRLSDA